MLRAGLTLRFAGRVRFQFGVEGRLERFRAGLRDLGSGSVKKGPAFVSGAKGTVMQRGRLGGIPLPRTFPNSGRWNWFRDGRPPASYSREGRERFGGAR